MRKQSCGENSASNKKSGSNYTLGTFLSFLSSLSFSFSFLSFHDPPSPLCNLSIPFRVNEQMSKASKKRARRVEEVTNPQVFSFFRYAAIISFTNEFAGASRIVALREIFISPLKPSIGGSFNYSNDTNHWTYWMEFNPILRGFATTCNPSFLSRSPNNLEFMERGKMYANDKSGWFLVFEQCGIISFEHSENAWNAQRLFVFSEIMKLARKCSSTSVHPETPSALLTRILSILHFAPLVFSVISFFFFFCFRLNVTFRHSFPRMLEDRCTLTRTCTEGNSKAMRKATIFTSRKFISFWSHNNVIVRNRYYIFNSIILLYLAIL